MITVRFPNGFSVQYNNLNYMGWAGNGGAFLYETAEKRDAKRGWQVSVPKECLIEFTQPCRTYDAAINTATGDSLDAIHKELNGLKRAINKEKKAR